MEPGRKVTPFRVVFVLVSTSVHAWSASMEFLQLRSPRLTIQLSHDLLEPPLC